MGRFYFFFFLSGLYAQPGARSQDPEIQSHMLHQLTQPGALMYYFLNFSYGHKVFFLCLMCNYELAILLKRNDINVDSFYKSIEKYIRFK